VYISWKNAQDAPASKWDENMGEASTQQVNWTLFICSQILTIIIEYCCLLPVAYPKPTLCNIQNATNSA
jgi:hypothetical protein